MSLIKKVLAVILSSLMVSGMCFTLISYAEERSGQIDFDAMYNRAVNGISDVPVSELPNVGKFKMVGLDGEEYEVKTHITAERLAPRVANGTEVIAVTVIADTSKDAVTRAGTSRPAETWDQTYGIKAYSTIYYDIKYIGNEKGYLLTRVSGGFQINDNWLGLRSLAGQYGCWGAAVGGGSTGNQTGRLSFSNNTFNKSTGFSKYITLEAGADLFGCQINATVVELNTSNTWNISLDNTL